MTKDILEMIENVDPSDTDKLDEIDARVWCFDWKEEYIGTVNGNHMTRGKDTNGLECGYKCGIDDYCLGNPIVPKYTRSLDAIKSITPDGWQIKIEQDSGLNTLWDCTLLKFGARCEVEHCIFTGWSCELPTEELARLHATIQAIEYERTHNG